ncbi:uncharacterized protein [Amphiura filiformis]|uniref:uncharacterized protein n=1 Tax=Amphiura filiformis TaxID=82378 RepID=UPI003B2117CE
MDRTMLFLWICIASLGYFSHFAEAWNMRDMSIKTMSMINNPQYSNYLMAKYRQKSSWVLCRYGGYRVDCCFGWVKERNGLCTPVCDNGCAHGTCVGPNRCQCEKGWTGDTCNIDYNECRDKPCHHRCMNSLGSYKCYCLRGYALSMDKKTCVLDYRCQRESCAFGCEQIIDNKFQCFCPEGMRTAKDGFNCIDIDECAEGLVQCPSDQQCVNTYGNWMCMCKEGFAFSMVNGKLQCKARNQCEDLGLKCHVNARCVETPAGFKCICNDGYVGDGSTCIPIDPRRCSDRPCFHDVECFNVPLNVDTIDFQNTKIVKLFKCGTCPRGFEGDGETCTDVNECSNGEHNCHQFANCVNTYGSFECTCRRNYAGNGTHCIPIDQTTCADRPCFPGVECYNTFLGVDHLDFSQVSVVKMYQCGNCPPGFAGDGENCYDINECLTGQHDCHQRANCVNTEGSYQCVCQEGYAGDGKVCVRLDGRQCSDRPCFPLVECTDRELRDILRSPNWRSLSIIKLFQCGACPQGYEGDGEVCRNINECQRGIDNCHRYANCIDNPGSFTCECSNGYAGDGRTCIRLDGRSCADRPCFPNVVCQDVPLRRILSSPDWQSLRIIKLYQCGECPEGYEGDGETCSDANECLTGEHNCHRDARCINERGAHRCECRDGFIGDGVNFCVPIDPTQCSDNPCFDNVPCRNLPLDRNTIDYRTVTLVKQYECGNCPPGYTGDGENCRDVNECLTGAHDCHRFATCYNTVGSYECRCNNDYLGDGRICIPIDRTTCANQPCFQGVRCTNVFPNFADIDPRRTTIIKLYQCGPCPPGYTGDGERCEDINECLTGDYACDRNARCVNTIGSYRCDCNEGFVGDGQTCIPLDPTTCRDRPCFFSREFGAAECTDVPLQQAYNPSLLAFLEEVKLYRCGNCPLGFTGDGETCDDVDECRQGTDDCHPNAHCVNTIGSYRCECNIGYAGDGRICIPVDPTTCRDRPCFTGVVCTDIPLNLNAIDLENTREIKLYECGPCPPGFFGADGITCYDENECLRGAHNCHVNATCRNIPGGFNCECNIGHIGNGTYCIPLDPRICANEPCFPGVDCFDIQINDIDFYGLNASTSIVKLFQCGPCPEDYAGDGEFCKKLPPKIVSQQLKVIAYDSNVIDNDGLISDVRVRVFVAEPTEEFGTKTNIFEGAESALTGPNGIASLTVPHNQTIIVTAQKIGYLLNSVTYRPRIDQANALTFEMTQPSEFNEFRWRSEGSRAFEFGDVAAGNLFRIEIPPAGLAVRERNRVRVEFHPINTTIPEALAEAPELIAAVRNRRGGYDLRALETIGMADLIITDVSRQKPPRVVNPFIIEIPIQIEPGNIRPGDTMDAWNFDDRKGVWVRRGTGTFRLAEEGYLVWQYQADSLYFTWWAAGRVWEDTSCITVSTCYDPFCFRPASDIIVTLTGVDFRYQASRTTDENGKVCMPFTLGGLARITIPCTDDSYVVQGSRRPSKCSNAQTQYDIPKFQSPVAIEDNCETYKFTLPEYVGSECYDPGAVVNGQRYGLNFKYGSEVIYECNEGYRLTADSSSTRVCTKCGDWTGQIPTCESAEVGGYAAFSSSSASIDFPNY